MSAEGLPVGVLGVLPPPEPEGEWWRAPRRLYIRAVEGSLLESDLRGIGAHWDAEIGAWWVSSGRMAVNAVLDRTVERAATFAKIPVGAVWVRIRYSDATARSLAKALGGVYNPVRQAWAMPDDGSAGRVARAASGGG